MTPVDCNKCGPKGWPICICPIVVGQKVVAKKDKKAPKKKR